MATTRYGNWGAFAAQVHEQAAMASSSLVKTPKRLRIPTI